MVVIKVYRVKPVRRDGPLSKKRQTAPHRPPDVSGKSRLLLAMEWLDGQVPVGVQMEAGATTRRAAHAGHTRATVARARWRVGIVSRRQSNCYVNAPWIWTRTSPDR